MIGSLAEISEMAKERPGPVITQMVSHRLWRCNLMRLIRPVVRRNVFHRQFLDRERNFTGFHFWARSYCVSTIGLDEQKVRAYIRDQEEEEKRQEVLPFGGVQSPSRGKPGA